MSNTGFDKKSVNISNISLYRKRNLPKMILLILVCLVLNIVPSRIAVWLDLPLYLDNCGTLLSTLIGGILPGVVVGFFSNVINSISEPSTIFYGFLSTLIALACNELAKRGMFKNVRGILLSIFVLAMLGGGLGSLFTWALNGFNFGDVASSPLVKWLYDKLHLPKFAAQLTGDILVDILDKMIVVSGGVIIYSKLPQRVLRAFRPLAHVERELERRIARGDVKSTLIKRVTKSLKLLEIALSVIIVVVSFGIYRSTITNQYQSMAASTAQLSAKMINGDRIRLYLEADENDEEYNSIKNELTKIQESFDEVKYVYIYRFEYDGVHVVFDLDSYDENGKVTEKGLANGEVIGYDAAFEEMKNTVISGGEIKPFVTTDEYGWLMTACAPICDSKGKVQAYACVDVKMNKLGADEAIFIVKVLSLLLGLSMIIIVVLLYNVEKDVIYPISVMEQAASNFAYESEVGRRSSLEKLQGLDIDTKDEVGILYRALTKLAAESVQYIEKTQHDAEVITTMQEGIILDFANMVECRDKSTGDHIKKTAYYVDRIARELIDEGVYTDELNEDRVKSMVRSAPLHDVGKIKISDVILNKPGKLTDEEFELMKTHTTEGMRILSDTIVSKSGNGYLDEAVDMAYCHHERWDGTGYPRGLKGEEIPLSARVMAVADVFDALVSRRSYKEPFPFDKAVDIIKEESGTHFDPKVVYAFLKVSESLRTVVEQNNNKKEDK